MKILNNDIVARLSVAEVKLVQNKDYYLNLENVRDNVVKEYKELHTEHTALIDAYGDLTLAYDSLDDFRTTLLKFIDDNGLTEKLEKLIFKDDNTEEPKKAKKKAKKAKIPVNNTVSK